MGRKLAQVFRASFYDYALVSYCSDIARQHMNVETCSKSCVSFLPVSPVLVTIRANKNNYLIDLTVLAFLKHKRSVLSINNCCISTTVKFEFFTAVHNAVTFIEESTIFLSMRISYISINSSVILMLKKHK